MGNAKKLSLKERILKLLKLDDDGKVEKFLSKEIKRFKREIVKLESNLKANSINYDNKLSEFKERIEDAKEEIEFAYENVDLVQLKNNESMNNYSNKYWNNITRAEQRLADIEFNQDANIKIYEEATKDTEEQIAKYKARISKIK